MKKNPYGKVLVLMGGWSKEREISLISGNAVYESLLRSNIDAVFLDLNKNNINEIERIAPDRVFNILHGKGGEDGYIQKFLEDKSIPFTGSDYASSRLSMNKCDTKDVLLRNNISTPRYVKYLPENELQTSDLNFPLVIKPSSEGSSIGVKIYKERSKNFTKEIYDLYNEYSDIMIEDYISGIECTVAILNNEALPTIKLETSNLFYDYEAKYLSDETKYICPSGFSTDLEEKLKKISLKVFKILGAKGWGRVDIILDENQVPWVIELNTIPGMTKHSLVPMAALQNGINFDDLVLQIMRSTLEQ